MISRFMVCVELSFLASYYPTCSVWFRMSLFPVFSGFRAHINKEDRVFLTRLMQDCRVRLILSKSLPRQSLTMPRQDRVFWGLLRHRSLWRGRHSFICRGKLVHDAADGTMIYGSAASDKAPPRQRLPDAANSDFTRQSCSSFLFTFFVLFVSFFSYGILFYFC